MISAKILITCTISATILISSCYSSNHANNPFYGSIDDHHPNNNHFNVNADAHHGIKLASWRWTEVEPYFLITTFLLLAAIVKIIYHHLEPVHAHIPESCVLIVLGSLIGLIFHSADYGAHLPFNRQLFFMILLPPIILESSYSLHDRQFFFNLKSILLYAILGTILNIFLVGSSLYLVGQQLNLIPNTPSFLELLTFSTIISAVDPVAVLAIFHEIGVNKSLYFLVFGESLLNDAVVITIYNVITTITNAGSINAKDVGLGIASFFTVSLGGVSIGVLFGILTALITRTTKKVQVVEPLIVIVLAYLSYICSELFHFSGIIGLICCGLVQSEYMTDNIAPHSLVTIKYFTKTCSSISDVIIFFYLGRVLVRDDHVWDTSFVCFSTLFCIIYRFLSVFLLTLVANRFMQSIKRINFGEQLLMAYGGLRGAISFSLAISLDEHNIQNSRLFITTTLFIILFTVFILGSTTKPVIKWLHVKLAPKDVVNEEGNEEMKNLMFIEITERTISTIMSGIEEIADCSSVHTFAQRFSRFNNSILKRFLTHDDGTGNYGHSFKRTYQKVADRIIRRSIDDTATSSDVQIDMELDPLNDDHYRTPWRVNNNKRMSQLSHGHDENISDVENTETKVSKPRRKVLRKAATLSTTYKHRYQQQKPPTFTHSMSTIEPRNGQGISDTNQNTIGTEDDDDWVNVRRRSSHNRRIVSTLFDSSQYYHLPRRDVLVETGAMDVQRVMRQTSKTPRSRGLSISSSNRRSNRRRSRSFRGGGAEEDPSSPPNTPTTPTAPIVTHLL